MAEQLATHAALALELADGRADEERIAVLEDRHRIARDLHDHVIQRIFATALSLEAVTERAADTRSAGPSAVRSRISTRRSGRIRASIFELQEPPSSPDARAVLLEVVSAADRGSRRRADPAPRGPGRDASSTRCCSTTSRPSSARR